MNNSNYLKKYIKYKYKYIQYKKLKGGNKNIKDEKDIIISSATYGSQSSYKNDYITNPFALISYKTRDKNTDRSVIEYMDDNEHDKYKTRTAENSYYKFDKKANIDFNKRKEDSEINFINSTERDINYNDFMYILRNCTDENEYRNAFDSIHNDFENRLCINYTEYFNSSHNLQKKFFKLRNDEKILYCKKFFEINENNKPFDDDNLSNYIKIENTNFFCNKIFIDRYNTNIINKEDMILDVGIDILENNPNYFLNEENIIYYYYKIELEKKYPDYKPSILSFYDEYRTDKGKLIYLYNKIFQYEIDDINKIPPDYQSYYRKKLLDFSNKKYILRFTKILPSK